MRYILHADIEMTGSRLHIAKYTGERETAKFIAIIENDFSLFPWRQVGDQTGGRGLELNRMVCAFPLTDAA